jgi:2-polyprenyl-3-methyl-5-hydroxy-6-metoxy-1,4-benzoquinol methylase
MQTFPPLRINRDCGDEELDSGREPLQLDWYIWARGSYRGKSVLDVGCGMGMGMWIMSKYGAKSVHGQEIDKRLKQDDVTIGGLDLFGDKSYDVVTCFDVIEHVPEDYSFFLELKRICRQTLFISTPNMDVSRATNPYHCREYTLEQFISYFKPDELWTMQGGRMYRSVDKSSYCFCGIWYL